MISMATDLLQRLLRPYRGLPHTVYIQIVSCLIINMGGMAKLFLPLYLHESYAVPYAWVGLMLSAYGLGALVGSYRGGSLSDRYDSRILAKVFMALAAVSLLLLSLPIPLWLFTPVLVLSGLSDGAFRPVNQRLALEPCPPARRAQAQGMLRVAFNLGFAVSGITGGFLAQYGYHWVYLSDAVAAFGATLWMVFAYRHFSVALGPSAPNKPANGSHLQSPWSDKVFLRMLVGLCIATAVFDQMYSTLGLFLRQHYHLGPQWLGYLFSLNGLMIVTLQVPIARRINRWGIGRCAQSGIALSGISYLVLLLGNGPFWALLMTVTISIGELLQSPAMVQLVMMRSEGRLRGRYMGLFNAAWAGRTLYAPAIGTWVYGTAGSTVLWLGCAVAALLAILLQRRPIQIILEPPTV